MPQQTKNLKNLAKLFLKLGFTAFGGPAAHIAMLEKEVVQKRKWVSEDHFLDLIGATNLIPGPNSTEMTMHIGHEKAGWKGLIVAGICFILPAVLITGLLAWSYKEYGSLPEVHRFIYGIKPAIIAIVVALTISLGKKAIRSIPLALLFILCAALALAGVNEIYVLFGAGALGILLELSRGNKTYSFIPLMVLPLGSWKIFWVFLKVGAILYGSGYVLFAFLEAELVSKGILSRQVLIDAIAVGQFTPGPVFSSATFIGWQLGGFYGAIAATVGIFLPSFLFVAFLNPIIPKLRKSKLMSAFLDMVNVASVALILAVCIQMGKESITDWRSILIALAGFFFSFFFPKVNSAFIVLGGAVLGWILMI